MGSDEVLQAAYFGFGTDYDRFVGYLFWAAG
jgi:hypothetical protein